MNNNNNRNNIIKNFNNSSLIQYISKWEGDNFFVFKGLYLFGPTTFKSTLLTFISISVPIVLILVFSSSYIIKELNVSLIIIEIFLYILTIFFLIKATISDPGILRRFPISNNNSNNFYTFNGRKKILINQLGYLQLYKYCSTCNIIRPNRSTHCGDCNNCVERFDHHCPWIGNCAGKRNYKFFFFFIVFLNILTIFNVIICLIIIIKKIKKENNNNNDSLSKQISKSLCESCINLFVIIYCILSMFFTTSLIIYHSKLVNKNLTTKEELKKMFVNPWGNPYKRNITKNWKNVLNPKLNKNTILDFLKWIDIKKLKDKNEKEKKEKINQEEIKNKNEYKIIETNNKNYENCNKTINVINTEEKKLNSSTSIRNNNSKNDEINKINLNFEDVENKTLNEIISNTEKNNIDINISQSDSIKTNSNNNNLISNSHKKYFNINLMETIEKYSDCSENFSNGIENKTTTNYHFITNFEKK